MRPPPPCLPNTLLPPLASLTFPLLPQPCLLCLTPCFPLSPLLPIPFFPLSPPCLTIFLFLSLSRIHPSSPFPLAALHPSSPFPRFAVHPSSAFLPSLPYALLPHFLLFLPPFFSPSPLCLTPFFPLLPSSLLPSTPCPISASLLFWDPYATAPHSRSPPFPNLPSSFFFHTLSAIHPTSPLSLSALHPSSAFRLYALHPLSPLRHSAIIPFFYLSTISLTSYITLCLYAILPSSPLPLYALHPSSAFPLSSLRPASPMSLFTVHPSSPSPLPSPPYTFLAPFPSLPYPNFHLSPHLPTPFFPLPLSALYPFPPHATLPHSPYPTLSLSPWLRLPPFPPCLSPFLSPFPLCHSPLFSPSPLCLTPIFRLSPLCLMPCFPPFSLLLTPFIPLTPRCLTLCVTPFPHFPTPFFPLSPLCLTLFFTLTLSASHILSPLRQSAIRPLFHLSPLYLTSIFPLSLSPFHPSSPFPLAAHTYLPCIPSLPDTLLPPIPSLPYPPSSAFPPSPPYALLRPFPLFIRPSSPFPVSALHPSSLEPLCHNPCFPLFPHLPTPVFPLFPHLPTPVFPLSPPPCPLTQLPPCSPPALRVGPSAHLCSTSPIRDPRRHRASPWGVTSTLLERNQMAKIEEHQDEPDQIEPQHVAESSANEPEIVASAFSSGPSLAAAAGRSGESGTGGEAGVGEEQPPVVVGRDDGEDVGEGVRKVVVKEGNKEKGSPDVGCTVFVHYRAWLANSEANEEKGDGDAGEEREEKDGEGKEQVGRKEKRKHAKVYDTWDEGQMTELILGHEKAELRGLSLGVRSMHPGERCVLRVPSALAYGTQGCFSFPHVPPNSDLLYEAKLVGFEKPPGGADRARDRSQMTADERIEAADRHRQAGNEAFRGDNMEEALREYEMALGYMGDEFMMQMFGKYRDMANAVRLPTLLNSAAAHLKLNNYNETIGLCTLVLSEEPDNPKALFRRGKARHALGQLDASMVDIKSAAKRAPGDAAIARELAALKKAEREAMDKQKEMFKGIFKPQPAAPVANRRMQWLGAIWQYVCVVLSWFWPFGKRKTD
ncbi:unnamed protein product [Closterium sp. NIES-53]